MATVRQPKSILGRQDKVGKPKYLKALFYGAPGTGKTSIVATAPKLLLLDTDGGATTVRDQDNITVVRVTEWSDIQDVLHTLMREEHPWESVAIDTLTTMQMVAEVSFNLAQDYIENRDPRRTYARMAAMIRAALVSFTNLPMHVLFTAHQRVVGEEDLGVEEGVYSMMPDIQPAVARLALALPDVIGHTHFIAKGGNLVQAVRFGPNLRSVTKERNLGLPPVALNVTIPEIIDIIRSNNPKEE
jgi:phage nucleotide-binding protein